MSEDHPPAVWWEISLKVNEELAELVADVMARFASGGVAIGYDSIEPDPDGEGMPARADLWCAPTFRPTRSWNRAGPGWKKRFGIWGKSRRSRSPSGAR